MPDTPRIYRPLLYIGLTLVGLLAGILVTLLMTRPGGAGDEGRPRVEVVELGGRSALPPIVLPDGLAERGYLDALTLNDAFKTVSSLVTPSVVFIEVESEGGGIFHRFQGGGIRASAGSGVIISGDGYVVTNHHVIENATRIVVTLSDKREFEAELAGDDPNTDLAVIRLTPNGEPVANLPAVALGSSDAVEVGEWVLAVGNPFRLTSTVTAGIVSAMGRQVNIIADQLGIENFIQTDAAINPGNSGGALVNLRGELVGIATAIATESGSYEGYGFAVPVDLMKRVVRDLIEFGSVQRGYLGVTIEGINAARARDLGLGDVRGVYLRNVRRGMAAWDAGLRSGDVLLTIEGRRVDEPNELQGAIALYRPGDRLDVEIWRDGTQLPYDVELFGREDDRAAQWFAELDGDAQTGPGEVRRDLDQQDPGIPDGAPHGEVLTPGDWGIGLIDVSSRIAQVFGVESGAYVMFVENGSPADAAEMPRNVVVTGVGSQDVSSVKEVVEALEAAAEEEDGVILRVVRRDGSVGFFELETGR